MNNYYKSKCCGEQVASVVTRGGVFERICLKCLKECEVTDMMSEKEVRDSMCDYWYEKGRETQKAEIISLIYSMILNKEVDDLEASKIVNKIRQ
jgi:hypothetical protein